MKTISVFFSLLFITSLTFAQSAADEKAVRAVIQKMDDAWNAHDYTYTGKYDIYAPDAVMINPVGMYWKNRGEIQRAHKAYGETMFKYGSAKSEQVDVRFLAPTVAMATIKAMYRTDKDHTLPGGQKVSKGTTDYDMLNVILTKKNNDWKIASVQLTPINAQAAPHNPIRASR
ncbi:hypothetical protein GCM10023189_23040 [Nibrella saemangeumensis]|uniref:DUF4440 domain-containing protein n=1 Tax=Nibrella saemangeumensis TaxID=1084526 RepID=A0ABP8MV34_9BACT